MSAFKLQYTEPWAAQGTAHERAAASVSRMIAGCMHLGTGFPCCLCMLDAFLAYENHIAALRWGHFGPWSEFNARIAERMALR